MDCVFCLVRLCWLLLSNSVGIGVVMGRVWGEIRGHTKHQIQISKISRHTKQGITLYNKATKTAETTLSVVSSMLLHVWCCCSIRRWLFLISLLFCLSNFLLFFSSSAYHIYPIISATIELTKVDHTIRAGKRERTEEHQACVRHWMNGRVTRSMLSSSLNPLIEWFDLIERWHISLRRCKRVCREANSRYYLCGCIFSLAKLFGVISESNWILEIGSLLHSFNHRHTTSTFTESCQQWALIICKNGGRFTTANWSCCGISISIFLSISA